MIDAQTLSDLIAEKRDSRFKVFEGEALAQETHQEHFTDRTKFPKGYFTTPSTIRPVFLNKVIGSTYTISGYIAKRDSNFSNLNIFPGHVARDNIRFESEFKYDDGHERTDLGFILLHANFKTYGHLLLEMIPKLKIYGLVRNVLPNIPIILPDNAPAIVYDWIRFFCGDTKIVKVKTRLVLIEAYIPDMLIAPYAFGTAMHRFKSDCVEKAAGSTIDRADMLLISRRYRRQRRSDFRSIANWDDVERSLVSRGFSVVEPETWSIPDQISIFSKAKVIIGELSSALHNALFSVPGTTVCQINPFNSVQRQIALSCGHSIVSVLPDDEIIRPWPPSSQISSDFSVDPDRIIKALSSSIRLR